MRVFSGRASLQNRSHDHSFKPPRSQTADDIRLAKRSQGSTTHRLLVRASCPFRSVERFKPEISRACLQPAQASRMAPQVLIFGLPRTGTQSILDALEILGYEKTYHMRNVKKAGNIDDWITLLDQKYNSPSVEKIDLQRLKKVIDGFDVSNTHAFCVSQRN